MDLLEIANAAVFGTLAVLALRLWLQRRDETTRWLAAAFGAIGFLTVIGLGIPDDAVSRGGVALTVVKIVGLLPLTLFPYLLFRFTVALSPARRAAVQSVTVATAVVAIATLLLPSFPEVDEAPWWFVAWFVSFIVYWVGVTAVCGWRLWSAGRGEPTAARRRVRMIGASAVLFAGTILLSGATPGERRTGVTVLLAVLPLVAAALLFLAFAPPTWLRLLWRQRDEPHVRETSAALISADTLADATAAVLPRIAGVLGGRGVALVDMHDRVAATSGLTPDQARALAEAPPSDKVLRIPLRAGTVIVALSPSTPVFGDDELRVVAELGLLIDLAASRIDAQQALLEGERQHRELLERANADLAQLAYGISHDLRNPISAVRGYTQILAEGGTAATAETPRFLERILESTAYMDGLLEDLLELSRVGSVSVPAEPVLLADLVRDIADGLAVQAPQASFVVEDLPVVLMGPVRARQLFTNLLTNAVRHAGRPDVTVRVSGEPAGGRARIRVADDGVGVSAGDAERIFGIFERRSPAEGSGIGLAVCRKIVEQVGGSLHLDVAAADAPGAAFVIELPLAQTAAAAGSALPLEGTQA